MTKVRAPYVEWAKGRPRPRYDLAGSNLVPCAVADLPGAREALELAGPNDEGYAPLIEAIAARCGVETARVATAPGCSGANFLVCAALLEPGDEVLVERPAYDPLLAAPRLLGATVRRFERRFEDGYALDPGRVEAALTPRTRLIILTQPHNPSGVLASAGALDAVGELAARVGARVLVDEVYLDAVYDGRPDPAAARSPVFVSTSSLTKAYGLGGLRCGWVVGPAEVATAVRRARDLVDAVGAYPAEVLAALAFEHLERLAARARGILEPNLRRLREFVESRRELEWVPPQGGTVAFPRLRGVGDATPFVERLLRDHGVAVVPGAFFEAPAHFRIGFCGPAETLAGGLRRLAEALEGDAGAVR